MSYVTFFGHSAVLSVPAVLLRKLPIIGTRKRQTATPVNKTNSQKVSCTLIFFNEYGKTFNCVHNKILEYYWLLTALIYGLIGYFRSKLSDYEIGQAKTDS